MKKIRSYKFPKAPPNTTIKKYFIEVIELLQNYDLIENNYKYISQGKIYKTSKLGVKNISEGFILYEKLVI